MSCVSLSDAVSAECSLPAAAIKQTHSPVRSSSSEMDGRLCQERADGFSAQDADSSIFPAAQPTAAASKDCVVGLVDPLPSEAYCRICFEELALGHLAGSSGHGTEGVPSTGSATPAGARTCLSQRGS